jgi:hypothetical protein
MDGSAYRCPDRFLSQVRERFLRRFLIIELDENVARTAITLRQRHKLKVPGAIIWAPARVNNALLVTRNSKDFDPNDPSVLRIAFYWVCRKTGKCYARQLENARSILLGAGQLRRLRTDGSS